MNSEAVYELEVCRVVEETHQARSFGLIVPESLAKTFQYQSGQFLTFELEFAGRRVRRCYSMSSAPGVNAEITFTVKRVAEGLASNWFNDYVRPGSRLRVFAPAGRFTLTNRPDPLLFFAGGSGITPILSLIKTALAQERRPMRLLYANRDCTAIIFASEIEALAHHHPERLQVVHHLDQEAGILGADAVSRLAYNVARADAYLCGPAPFMHLIEKTLLGLDFPSERIFIERFLSPVEEIEVAALPVPGKGGRVAALIDGKRREFDVGPQETILKAARRVGLDPPSACENGICGTCIAHVISGRVTMHNNQLLSEREITDGLVLTCQARADSAYVEIAY